MFRTRDFVLLFTTIMFLATAIGATVWHQGVSSGGSGVLIPNAVVSDAEFEATVVTDSQMTRAERVTAMRDKIAAAPQLTASEVLDQDDVASEEDESEEESATSTETVAGPEFCPNYAEYIGFWDARSLSVVASEGAVVVSQTTTLANGSTSEQTIMQLPARPLPSGITACINSDVIGIANDGSLIRNDEIALYSVFGSSVQIGYALDGFPIYGTGTAPVDACGGRVDLGQYRYELQSEAQAIINCFAAAPRPLP